MNQKNSQHDPLTNVLESLFRGVGNFLSGALKGARTLRHSKARVVGLLVFLLIAGCVVWQWQQLQLLLQPTVPFPIDLLLLTLVALSPLLYLNCLSAQRQQEIKDQLLCFESIKFCGKDGQYPIQIAQAKNGNQIRTTYRSMIPLDTWRKNASLLEPALDRSILMIEPGKSKQEVIVCTLPGNYKMSDMLEWDDKYISNEESVVAIGQDDVGTIEIDLNRTPHILSAGETGSGKSVILRCILWQAIMRDAIVFMFDFKGGVEFGLQYEQFGEVITDRKRAIEVFTLLVEENAQRLALFRQMQVKNIKEYNQRSERKLARIVVCVDEIAEMLDGKGATKDVKSEIDALYSLIAPLARLSRATGINLVIGTQRPDATVLSGQIKNNIPVRFCGRFADKPASEIVLGSTMAVNLPDIKGRFIYKSGADFRIIQTFFFDDEKMLQPQPDRNPNATLLSELSWQSYLVDQRADEIWIAQQMQKDKATEPAPVHAPDPEEESFNFDF